MNGWKTYVTIVLMAVYNLLSQIGYLPGIDETSWQVFINVVLALLGVIFNFIGRSKIAKTGRSFHY